MNTTFTEVKSSAEAGAARRISHSIEYHWERDFSEIHYRFEVPGAAQEEIDVRYDTLKGVLTVYAYNSDKKFQYQKDVFKTIEEQFLLGRWNGKVDLMPLELYNGMLTVRLKCGLWAVQRGRFVE